MSEALIYWKGYLTAEIVISYDIRGREYVASHPPALDPILWCVIASNLPLASRNSVFKDQRLLHIWLHSTDHIKGKWTQVEWCSAGKTPEPLKDQPLLLMHQLFRRILLGPIAKVIIMTEIVVYASVFMWASSRVSLCSAPCSHHLSLFSCLFCPCQPCYYLPT